MIDRRAINILYNDQVGKKLVEDFYQLLVVYSQNKKTKPVESCLLKLNDIARKKKTRLVYYDNHTACISYRGLSRLQMTMWSQIVP